MNKAKLVVLGRQRPRFDPDDPGTVVVRELVFQFEGELTSAMRSDFTESATAGRGFSVDDIRIEVNGREVAEYDNPASYAKELEVTGS